MKLFFGVVFLLSFTAFGLAGNNSITSINYKYHNNYSAGDKVPALTDGTFIYIKPDMHSKVMDNLASMSELEITKAVKVNVSSSAKWYKVKYRNKNNNEREGYVRNTDLPVVTAKLPGGRTDIKLLVGLSEMKTTFTNRDGDEHECKNSVSVVLGKNGKKLSGTIFGVDLDGGIEVLDKMRYGTKDYSDFLNYIETDEFEPKMSFIKMDLPCEQCECVSYTVFLPIQGDIIKPAIVMTSFFVPDSLSDADYFGQSYLYIMPSDTDGMKNSILYTMYWYTSDMKKVTIMEQAEYHYDGEKFIVNWVPKKKKFKGDYTKYLGYED